jgi:phosphatidylglycerophosphate synthase
MVLTFEGAMELFQMVCPDFTLLNTPMVVLYNVALWASAVLTVISGVNYLVKNKDSLGLKDL